ncbi:hypothetical protein D6779_08820 [Candidatus Parcubacteria bacterium]|nr:MAG: hypothetical protein D6779_08820 [Candidatus Parcubacteria bacterium]
MSRRVSFLRFQATSFSEARRTLFSQLRMKHTLINFEEGKLMTEFANRHMVNLTKKRSID